MSGNLLEQYLTDLGEVRSTRSNAPETSFYSALEGLLTAIGKTLSPKVRCVINLANRGAGLPDGGLFSADQFRRKDLDSNAKENPLLSQNPSRGVIEAKPASEDIGRVAGTEQVERYWKRYGMVLVTNFRSFVLIGKGLTGQPCTLESFTLAESESEFWRLTAHPRQTAAEHGERLLDDRFDYGEQRFITLGILKDIVVSLVHTETVDQIHIISFRKATRNEQIIYFKNV